MSRKRKQYSAHFKAKVALEAVRGEKTSAELASAYKIHPTLINGWKHQLQEDASYLFDGSKSASKADSDTEAQIAELYRQIGQLTVKRDFLAKRCAQSGLPSAKPW